MAERAPIPSVSDVTTPASGDIAVPLALDAGAYDSAPFSTMHATSIEDQVRKDAGRAGCVPDNTCAAILAERAVAQADAAREIPLDPENFLSDRLFLKSLGAIEKLAHVARELGHQLAASVDAESRLRSSLPKAKGRGYRFALTACALLMCGAAVAASLAYMWPALVPMMTSLAPADADDAEVYAFAAQMARVATGSVVGTLALANLLLAVAVRDKPWLRWGATLMEAVAVASLMALRIGSGRLSAGILGFAGLESAVLVACGLVCSGIGHCLDREAARVDAYARANAKIEAIETAQRRQADEVARLDQQYAEHFAIIHRRDDGSRRHNARRDLVRLTAEAAYIIAVAEQLKTVAANAAEVALTERVEAHLDARFEGVEPTNREVKRA